MIGAGILARRFRRSRKLDLSRRVVLLTGGSRGLGLQLARELVKHGCRLILVARSEHELTVAKQELQRTGTAVNTIACDLAEPDNVKGMLTSALSLYGRIDIVINNAGRIDVGPIDSLFEKDFHAAMDLMFWAPVRIILGLLPTLLKSGDADIVNISSIGGKLSVPHLLPYSSAKFALCGFSEGLAAELRPRGVHVLTVTPGLVRTGSHKQASFGGDRAAEYRWFALGATVPGVSMEVGRAARQIVSALQARKSSLTLGWSAQLAGRVHGAFPSISLRALTDMSALLLSASSDRTREKGHQLAERQSSALKAITTLGQFAAETQNEQL